MHENVSVNIITENILPVFDYIASVIFVLLVLHPTIYEPCDHGLRLACDKYETEILFEKLYNAYIELKLIKIQASFQI